MQTEPPLILFIGVFNPSSTNFSQASCLEKQGAIVRRYGYRKQLNNLQGPDARDTELIKIINELRPDFTITAKGSGINIRIYESTSCCTKHLLWYPDTLNSNWNRELREKIQVCDYVACAWKGPAEKAKEINDQSFHVPEGFDPDIDQVIPDIKPDINVSFIGNLDGTRRPYHKAYPFQVFDNAFGYDHARAVCQSKINLNFTRKGGTSDRVYKVLAARGFLLTQPWPGMEDEFTPGKDFVLFNDAEDMKRKIMAHLDADKLRNMIAAHGHETVQQYSRNAWAHSILEIVK